MTDYTELFSIGQLARRTGVAVRTIRFWSDAGIVPPTDRSAGGYRLYGAEAVARLDLVRTLRELGLDLGSVERILAEQATVADVASAHARALDAEIRVLHLRRAVLRSVARHGSSTEEMRLMHKMARLSAQERQQIIDEFVDRSFDGVPSDAPGAGIAQAMRTMPASLPDDPSPEQVDAWVELAELVGDESFQQRVRQMAVSGAQNNGDTPAHRPIRRRFWSTPVRPSPPGSPRNPPPDGKSSTGYSSGRCPPRSAPRSPTRWTPSPIAGSSVTGSCSA